MTVYDLVVLFFAVSGIALAIIAQMRISRNEEDLADWKIDSMVCLDDCEAIAKQANERLQALESPVLPDEAEDPADPVDPEYALQERLFTNAAYCQQSTRNWMHECQWWEYVSNQSIKTELEKLMKIVSEYPSSWYEKYIITNSITWAVEALKVDPGIARADQAVRDILPRLRAYAIKKGKNPPKLKAFPLPYKQ